MSRPNTQNAGAALERQALRRKLCRYLSKPTVGWGLDFLEWIDKRTERANKAPGGLGKKR